MTQEEQDKIMALCRQVAVEKDPKTFNALVAELNDLLKPQHRHLRSEREKASS